MSFVLSIPLLSKAWGALHHSLHLTNEAKQGEGTIYYLIQSTNEPDLQRYFSGVADKAQRQPMV